MALNSDPFGASAIDSGGGWCYKGRLYRPLLRRPSMSSILVVEQEQRSVERINQALGGEGWRVRVVPGRVQALQAAASEAPDLVLLSSDIPGAAELANSFQRSAGGPGVVVILPERAEVGSGSLPADDRLARPFTEQDLRIVVRRVMAV